MTSQTQEHPKIADTDHSVIDLIEERWSPRAFSHESVDKKTLLQLLEAARWAPSSGNEQPWRFIIATKEDLPAYEHILACLNERNRQWAHLAPVLMLTVAKMTRNDKPNRHAWHDVGLAMGNLVAQATALGLFVHQMAGIHPEKAREVFAIPEEYEVVTGVALGYLGEPEVLPEDRQQAELKPRTRRPLETFVFGDTWGEPAPLLEQ